MTIRPMTLDDLRTVLGWAADEGWNPGLDDAAAFLTADPAGFLIKEIDGQPVSAISVVNHDANFAFLGLYLCKPEFRRQGHGIDIWRAGVAHAGPRSIGLDGVPDQQANYARSGFVRYGSTVRYEGQIAAANDPRVRPAFPSDLPVLIARDIKATGMQRAAFAKAWISPSPNRQTMVLADGSEITGFATFRRCGHGTKIGPLQALTETDVQAILAANPFSELDGPIFVDVLDHSTQLSEFLQEQSFVQTFETARMYRGISPVADSFQYEAISTMELG